MSAAAVLPAGLPAKPLDAPPAGPPALSRLPHWRCRAGGALVPGERTVPEETAIAFVYDGSSHAVMMATPDDLEDFAVGFSLTEGRVRSAAQIRAVTVHPRGDDGIELHITTTGARACSGAPRRSLAGPTGCGLCGVQSLHDAQRAVVVVQRAAAAPGVGEPSEPLAPAQIARAMEQLEAAQAMNRETRALHAAALWLPGAGIVALREDVGRHNALDKLAGALARQGFDAAAADRGTAAVLLTSRVSVELVQKTARIGAALIVAISAPTALAVRTAQACGITLAALARGGDFEVYCHAGRIR